MPSTRRSSTLARRRSAIIRRAPQGLTWNELVQRIENDPCFNVHTADGKYWIDPFTGKHASAAKNNRSAALRHYFESFPHWQKYPVKSLHELMFWRWVHFLNEHIRNEQRLRFFKQNGEWLNPFTGSWHSDVRRVEGRITSMTLHEMAKVLAVTVTDGPAEMLSFAQLRAIIEEEHQRIPQPVGVTTKDLSGIASDPAPATSSESDAPASEDGASEDQEAAQPEPSTAAVPAHPRARIRGPETQRAQKVQTHLLGGLPEVPGYQFVVGYHPMSSVSGDFYDVRYLDEQRLMIAVGDVSGHGVQAALAMATVLKSLRTITRNNSDLIEIACLLNDDVKGDLLGDQFVTMWLAILHLQECRLECLSAGHHPALIANPEGEHLARRIMSKGAAIGMSSGERIRATYRAQTIDLQPGDLLIQYTDGLSEAMDAEREEFGDMRVCAEVIKHLQSPQLDQLVDGVINGVLRWSAGKQEDDLTLLAMRISEDRSAD